MKILLINTLYYPNKIGGAEISVQILAEELVKLGNEVYVISLTDSKCKSYNEINGVHVVYMPLRNIYWPFDNVRRTSFKKILWHLIDMYNPFMKRDVLKEIKLIKPDVVHTNNLSGFSVSLWGGIKQLGIKIVHTSRDYYLFHPNSTLYDKINGQISLKSLRVFLFSFHKKKQSRFVDYYIGISEFIKDIHIREGFFCKAINACIYNPIQNRTYPPGTSDTLMIGFIGRCSPEKGFPEYCQLARRYINDNRLKFYAAGVFDPKFNKEYEILVKNSGVNYLGYTNFDAFIRIIDVVVLPINWNEPFGRTVAESLLAGRTVFTNEVGGITEMKKYFPSMYKFNEFDEKINEIESVSKKHVMNVNPFDIKDISLKYLNVYRYLVL